MRDNNLYFAWLLSVKTYLELAIKSKIKNHKIFLNYPGEVGENLSGLRNEPGKW